ncbi:hypothetical protein ABGB16_29145 [Micromonospora sp. B11E3]
MPQLFQGLPGTAAGCHELPSPTVERTGDQVLLAGERLFAQDVLELFHHRH